MPTMTERTGAFVTPMSWRALFPSSSTITVSPTPGADEVDSDDVFLAVEGAVRRAIPHDELLFALVKGVLDSGHNRPADAAEDHEGLLGSTGPSW
jgi:hypothetical protein